MGPIGRLDACECLWVRHGSAHIPSNLAPWAFGARPECHLHKNDGGFLDMVTAGRAILIRCQRKTKRLGRGRVSPTGFQASRPRMTERRCHVGIGLFQVNDQRNQGDRRFPVHLHVLQHGNAENRNLQQRADTHLRPVQEAWSGARPARSWVHVRPIGSSGTPSSDAIQVRNRQLVAAACLPAPSIKKVLPRFLHHYKMTRDMSQPTRRCVGDMRSSLHPSHSHQDV
jgi:hypothetical protein